ncbi:hypothetical protein ACFX2I_005361 [Malus domestica]
MQIHGRIYVVPRPSGFVHQHLAPSVGIDTKSYVDPSFGTVVVEFQCSPRGGPLGVLLLLPPPTETHRQEQTLSFSNNKSEVSFLNKDGDFAYYQKDTTPIFSPYPRNAGLPGYGSLNLSIHGPLTGLDDHSLILNGLSWSTRPRYTST